MRPPTQWADLATTSCRQPPRRADDPPAMGLISEFKTFAVKGNAMDLAVGVILVAAPVAFYVAVVRD